MFIQVQSLCFSIDFKTDELKRIQTETQLTPVETRNENIKMKEIQLLSGVLMDLVVLK